MVEQASSGAKPRRIWKVVFALSLALNLAIVGVVVGALVSGRLGDKPPRSFDLGVGPVARALSPAERREVGRDLVEQRVLRNVDLRARVREIVAVLRAEPFDADAMQDLFEAQSRDLAATQRQAQRALLETISAMSPERRAAFADDILQGIRRGPRERANDGNSGG